MSLATRITHGHNGYLRVCKYGARECGGKVATSCPPVLDGIMKSNDKVLPLFQPMTFRRNSVNCTTNAGTANSQPSVPFSYSSSQSALDFFEFVQGRLFTLAVALAGNILSGRIVHLSKTHFQGCSLRASKKVFIHDTHHSVCSVFTTETRS